jgi:hypothetical protein
MAEEDIVQNSIRQLGQSQQERLPKELGAHFARVDERRPADFLRFARRLAGRLRYYFVRDDAEGNPALTDNGDWTPFFPSEEEAANGQLHNVAGTVRPHLALYIAFLRLFEQARAVINRITRRHLDFFYREVLKFQPRGPRPDRAHLLLELKKNAAPVAISPDHRFSAGKDAKGVELVYAPVRETIVRTARVASLRSVYVDAEQRGTVRFAPVADSPDGTGSEWKSADRSWPAFGGPALPPAPIGFALASPVLRMREGRRQVTCSVLLGNVDFTTISAASLVDVFDVFVTGEKGWLGPYRISPSLSADGLLTFDFAVNEADAPVVDYDPAVHGQAYAAQAPVMQVVLTGEGAVGYADLRRSTVRRAKLSVDVSAINSITLENDFGTLDSKKAFMPFGPQPVEGSRFMVGCGEALSKKLSALSIRMRWQAAPPDFAAHYKDYGVSRTEDSLTASVSFQDGGSWRVTERGVTLFKDRDGEGARTFSFPVSATSPAGPSVSPAVSKGYQVFALQTSGGVWAKRAALRSVLISPMLFSFLRAVPESRPGFVTFSLDRDFLHATYRKKTVENALTFAASGGTSAPVVLEEPYTPSVQGISLSYVANTDDVNVGSTSVEDFSQPDIQFFHIGCFGQMREQGYQRASLDFVASKDVPLLPAYTSEGELMIGVAGLNPRDSLSLLFQVAEGTADPDLPRAKILWSVLCDNYWKPLGPSEVTLDTTNQLRKSGLVGLVVPAEATTANTLLPANLLWLKAEVAQDVAAVCRLIAVAANAVEVEFRDGGNDTEHLGTALAPKRIAKLKTLVAGVKTIDQPYASFGGELPETPTALDTRAAERLRHKRRCITAWDYERIVLESFPAVHRVKCVPHAREGEWLAPGHVMLVVVPDLRNRVVIDPLDPDAVDPGQPRGADPLQPKVDADTVSRITDFVRDRSGMQVVVRVKNPTYQKVRLDFKVRFYPSYEFNYYSRRLSRELVQLLSPWAFDEERLPSFGGRVYKSSLLDFVEEREYVDYVTDFKMFSFVGDDRGADVAEASAATPDAILVSDREHSVAEVSQAAAEQA